VNRSTQPVAENTSASTSLLLESRPTRLIAARYDHLPFPANSLMQEFAFDLGITAVESGLTVGGMVVQGFNDHQLLIEQRWPARVLLKRTGEADLTIPPGTGLAVRGLQFLLHGYEQLTHVAITVVANADEDGARHQATIQLPVVYHQQQTDLHFPLQGAWWAIQAADWSDQHKQEVFSQTYAIDFVKLGPNNGFFQNDGRRLEDHFSWHQPVYATAGGKVAFVCYDMPDLPPGEPANPLLFRGDPRRLLGNAVAISHGNGEFSYFAHLQQATIQVNVGEIIRRGTFLGRVGNSGQSPGPHLHFHLMEGPNLFIDQGLPAAFSHFWAGGQFFDQPTTIPTRMIVRGDEPILRSE
jgi:hypothetical protein